MQSVAEYYRVLQSIAEYCIVLQIIAEYCRVLQSIEDYCRVLQSVIECCRVLQCYRVLQSISSASTWTNFWACCDSDQWTICKSVHFGYYGQQLLFFLQAWLLWLLLHFQKNGTCVWAAGSLHPKSDQISANKTITNKITKSLSPVI